MTKTVTRAEPEWDEQQRAWMLALHLYRSRRCPGCGGDLRETTDPANREQYKALPPVECFRCIGLDRAARPYYTPLASGKPAHEAPHTLLHRVELRPPRG